MRTCFLLSKFRHPIFVFFVSAVMLLQLPEAEAAVQGLDPDKVFVADSQKTKFFVEDGLIVGGDEAIDNVLVLDIRHARNKGYERIVVDIEGNRDGDPVAIQRPPYYQANVSEDMKRIVFTVWGNPKLGFDPKKLKRGFGRSERIERVDLFPVLEKDRWMFMLTLKDEAEIEIFELADPVRIIADIRPVSSNKKKGK